MTTDESQLNATREPRAPNAPTGPLVGVRVIELAGIGPGQLGGMMLADLGADVVRIDRPADVPAGFDEPCRELLGRGRRSVALDLKSAEGRELACRLIDTADVLIDPYRPGVTERLGLGPDDLLARNARLVYARMTGWGQDGPLSQAAGHDINYIALAGALEPLGDADDVPPVPLNVIGDFGGGGMLMAFGVLAALLERERSGEGQVIDAAMVDGVATLMTGVYQLRAMGRWNEGRGRNWIQGAAPWYRAYRTADGVFVSVGPLEAKFYAILLGRLGIDPMQWPQFDTQRWPGLTELMAGRFAAETAAHWCTELEGTDACFAPALSPGQAPHHPHLVARSTYVEVDGVQQPAAAPRFSRTPASLPGSPPWAGQDSEAVLAELGLSPADREDLVAAGVSAPARRSATQSP